MASPNNRNIAGLRASQGLRFKQPFKSPLRVPGTENSKPKVSLNVTRSPTSRSGTSSSPSDRQSGEERDTNRGSDSNKVVQEGIGSSSTTPKRPILNSCNTGPQARLRKVSPRQFSSPFRSPVGSVGPPQETLSKEEELNQLLEREGELDEEISSLRSLGFKASELQGHIDNLHEYNDIKDAAQIVMGRLAELEGVTIKEMHEKYEVTTLD